MACLNRWLGILKNYKNILIVLLTPALFAPLLQDSWHIIELNKCDPNCTDNCFLNETTGLYQIEQEKRPYKCLYALVIMATYWTAEVTPLAVTSLIPMFLFPMLGILPAKEVAPHYFKDTNFLFFGGLIVAIAIEKCNLHLRIALSVMKLAGAKLHNLMAAFMIVTAFLSMWISNTATTAMMLPIAVATVKTVAGDDENEDGQTSESSNPEADQVIRADLEMGLTSSGNSLEGDGFEPQKVLDSAGSLKLNPCINPQIQRLKSEDLGFVSFDNSRDELIPSSNGGYSRVNQVDQSFQSVDNMNKTKGGYVAAIPKKKKRKSDENTKVLMKAMLLAVAFAANIGGIGTLIGTPVNLIMGQQLESIFTDNLNGAEPAGEINFLTWMYFAFPVAVVCVFGCWVWLVVFYMGPTKVINDLKKRTETDEDQRVKKQIRDKYNALGKMSYEEWIVGFHFGALAILWFTRSPRFISGWHSFFEKGHVRDSTAALAICFSLFLWPSKPNFFNYLLGRKYERDNNNLPKPSETILNWKLVQKTLAWDVIILLGAGFALATACQKSGLSAILGEGIGKLLNDVPDYLLPFLLALMISFITGFTSNTSTASVFIPIIASLCLAKGLNPLFLCIPVTMACSFAFILPIATPPNAIAFSYGYLETVDMIKVGVFLNILCVGVTAIMLPIIAYPAYNLGEFPAWAALPGYEQLATNATQIASGNIGLDVTASAT